MKIVGDNALNKLLTLIKTKFNSLAKVATSGSYNDLSNRPTIPTVGNGTITIKQAGALKGTFTTNQNGNTTIELTDSNTWRGIQDNLTSDSTTDSLSAAQGKVLKGLVDGKVNKRCQYGIRATGTPPYKYIYLCRIGNSVKYTGLTLNLRYNARSTPETNLSILISTGQYAYSNSWISALSEGSSINFYYVKTANDSSVGYDYYDIYVAFGAWELGYYEINQIGGSGTLRFTHKGTLVDSLPSGYVEIGKKYAGANHTHNYAGSSSAGGSATSAVKLQTARTIALSGGATGTATSFDGSANISISVTAIKPEYISDGYTTNGPYINTHPENAPAIIPFINNDIAFLLKRGGSAVVKYDGTVQSVDISSVFDGSPSYWSIIRTNISTITIELTLHKVFNRANTIYIDSGLKSWRAKDIKIEVINTNYTDDVWTQKGYVTNHPYGQYKVSFTHTPVGASNPDGGFNKIRLTFSNFASSILFKIAAIGVINGGSYGVRETFLPRDGGSVYGSITPYTNNALDLGSSSNKWKNIYATKFTGALTGNADTATKATQASEDSANQQITTTYIKGLSASGKTITYTKGDGSTGTITTQDTHYASGTVVTNDATKTGNYGSALTNGNVFLNHVENGVVKNSHKITGSGATTVTSDASGNITISSADNNAMTLPVNYASNVRNICHRGWGLAPENTMPAYKEALERGYKYVECDVSKTKDGVYVLLHDYDINRTSNGSGNIIDLTYAKVSKFNFNKVQSGNITSTYGNVKIPKFEEFIEFCRYTGLHPYIELKTYTNNSKNYQLELSDIPKLIKIVRDYNMLDNCTWFAHDTNLIKKVRELHPYARVGIVCDAITADAVNVAKELYAQNRNVFISPNTTSVQKGSTDANLQACKDAGIPIEVWHTLFTYNSSQTPPRTYTSEEQIKTWIKNSDPYVTGYFVETVSATDVLQSKMEETYGSINIGGKPIETIGDVGDVLYEASYDVNTNTSGGIWCDGILHDITSNNAAEIAATKEIFNKYKRLRIYARFPFGLGCADMPIDRKQQTISTNLGSRQGGIILPTSDNNSGANKHWLYKMHWRIVDFNGSVYLQITDSGWIDLGIGYLSADDYQANTTTALPGSSYLTWRQRHNDNYSVYKIVGYTV